MANKIWVGGTSGDYSVAGNWSPSGVPAAADNVYIQGSVSITAGLNQSAVAVASFFVDAGYTGTIGSATGYLQINPTSLDFSGTGLSFIDIGSAAISPFVRNTASVNQPGQAGLYMLGSAIATLTVNKGVVGVAWQAGETATIATAQLSYISNVAGDAELLLGSGVTLTTWNQTGGSGDVRCAATTVTIANGSLTTRGSGAVGTLNVKGGTCYPQSTGTITTANLDGGTTDFRRSRSARTVTTLTSAANGATVFLDTSVVTLTNKFAPSGLIKATFSQG